jgi:hypothetical protein
MKKRSLLMLLPFALIITGCSGNLKKGSIFNEKFMKRNFGVEVEETHQYVAPEKFELSLNEDGQTANLTAVGDLIEVAKDGVLGYYSLTTNSYVLPLSLGITSGRGYVNISASGYSMRLIYGTKTVEDQDTLYVFDDLGNKLYEGPKGAFGYNMAKIPSYDVKGNERFLVEIRIDNAIQAVAYYNVDGSLKEVLSREEYFNKYPYQQYGNSLAGYGHPELYMKSSLSNGEYRYSIYNSKRGKYVASFSVPEAGIESGVYGVGNYLYYQILEQLPERAKKYDFSDGNVKYNFTTYRVDYRNGKTKTINTKMVFADCGAIGLVNNKGISQFLLFNQVRTIEKDKVLSSVQRDVIVKQNLKEVADVTSVRLSTLTPYGKEYYVNDKGIVFDGKLREVGYIRDVNNGRYHIVRIDARYGLVNHKGEYVVEPIYKSITTSAEKDYYCLESVDSWKFVKMNEKEEIETLKELSKLDYTKGAAFTKYHLFTKTSDSSKYYVDAITGQEVEKQEAPEGAYQVFEGSVSRVFTTKVAKLEIYEKDGKYTVIRMQDNTVRSYPSKK